MGWDYENTAGLVEAHALEKAMIRIAKYRARALVAMLAPVLILGSPPANARTFKVLHSFSGGADGCYPSGGSLVLDGAGDIFGVTTGLCYGNPTYGNVFEIPAKGTEFPLYEFTGGSGGSTPMALVIDKNGNLWGTTCCGGIGGGVIFEITSKGTEKTVHTFQGSPDDGCGAYGAMIADKSGNLYGTTFGCGKYDYGTVYKLAPEGTESLVYSFKGGRDGYDPSGSLTIDGQGNLYGTTEYGGQLDGACNNDVPGCGTVFELAADGTKTVLYEFKGPPKDGEDASGNVITDAGGNFYGILSFGGRAGCEANLGCGAVFKLTAGGDETILHFFRGGRRDGGNPPQSMSLLADSSGNLYGTTEFGMGRNACYHAGCGMVFELAPDGTESILHSFGNGSKGGNPSTGLATDAKGHLYGTTSAGGTYNDGTVFEITP